MGERVIFLRGGEQMGNIEIEQKLATEMKETDVDRGPGQVGGMVGMDLIGGQ